MIKSTSFTQLMEGTLANDNTMGSRMKRNYEVTAQTTLPLRLPVVIRLDGKAFHTWTKDLDRPFDDGFIESMSELAMHLCREIQTAQIAYVQSDEISIFLHNYKRKNTEPFFGNNVQKIVSVSAGMASAFFTQKTGRIAVFDARVFVLPEAEVANYFIWRQQDAVRNSVQMFARSLYSHRECQNKNQSALHELLHARGVNWAHLPSHKKRGLCIVKTGESWTADMEPPTFSQNRDYIEKLLAVVDEE